MRETLSLFRLHHWRKSFWNGHYLMLAKYNGFEWIVLDTLEDLRSKVYHRLGYSLVCEWDNCRQRSVEYITKTKAAA